MNQAYGISTAVMTTKSSLRRLNNSTASMCPTSNPQSFGRFWTASLPAEFRNWRNIAMSPTTGSECNRLITTLEFVHDSQCAVRMPQARACEVAEPNQRIASKADFASGDICGGLSYP